MKGGKILLPVIILAVIILALWRLSAPEKITKAPINGNIASSKTLDVRQDNQGSVTIDVTPANIDPNNTQWQFEISLNTHSVELSDELTQSVVLVDASGKEYKPISWEGSPPGGHHREGFLIFSPIKPFPKTLELRMINVGQVPLRTFNWSL